MRRVFATFVVGFLALDLAGHRAACAGSDRPGDANAAPPVAAPAGGGQLSGSQAGKGFQLFPSDPIALAPVLSDINLHGDSALQPGALIPSDPLSSLAQEVKSRLASIGLTYQIDQAFVLSAMGDRVQGDAVLSAYTANLWSNWVIFRSDELGGTTGWITSEFGGGTGFGFDWSEQSPQQNLGTASAPYYEWAGKEIFVAEMAWAQSFADGRLAVLVGMIDQTNYFDINLYAGNAFGQLMNEAFVESQVLPMAGQSLGAVLQWQPVDWCYVLLGASTNNLPLGRAPWQDVSGSDMSYLAEIGLVSDDVLGLGAGRARIQPFVAVVDGETGGGVGLNIEQRLGRESPLGLFGRFGVGDDVTAVIGGAKAQAAGGLALTAPFLKSGIFSADNNDYIGLGVKWTKVGDATPAVHEDEYAVELTATFQLTPTITLQPDVQFFWDPAYSPFDDTFVFQMAINIQW